MPVSALRDEMRVDYPHWATRELLMNAICHRDYEGNGPVQFYQYDDRIEILNPGGLYGKKEVGKKTNKGADEKTNKDADNEINTEENIEQNRKTNKAAGKKQIKEQIKKIKSAGKSE